MEQEDYLKRQIDQLGRVLGKILADLTGLRSQGATGIGLEAADYALKEELGFDLSALASIPKENFIQTLQEVKYFSNENLDNLAGIMFLVAEEPYHGGAETGEKKRLYERSFIIYGHLEMASSTYSFDRHVKMDKIKIRLAAK
jgi:hypothetical protein